MREAPMAVPAWQAGRSFAAAPGRAPGPGAARGRAPAPTPNPPTPERPAWCRLTLAGSAARPHEVLAGRLAPPCQRARALVRQAVQPAQVRHPQDASGYSPDTDAAAAAGGVTTGSTGSPGAGCSAT